MDDDNSQWNEGDVHEEGGSLKSYGRNHDSKFNFRSTLTRGIHITEFPENRVNPTPLLLEESDVLLEQYLSPGKLQLLTGVDDLNIVRSLELKVDSRETSLGNFGSLLPNLVELNLNGSHIACMRDLGSALRNLRILWMARCGLEELDGISAMSELKELYLEYNEISDVSPLSMLEQLQVLDLEGNNIEDVMQLQYLSLCPALRKLAIDGNPVCMCPASAAQRESGLDFRDTVRALLPNLVILDDERLDDERIASTRHNVFDEDWAYLEELQDEACLQDHNSSQQDKEAAGIGAQLSDRPLTAALHPATEYRPGSALRPSSGFRPMSSSKRPSSTSGSSASLVHPAISNRPISSDAIDGIEPVSDLTVGSVICGNPSKALRQRKLAKVSTKEEIDKKLGTPCQKTVVPIPSEEAADAYEAVDTEMSNILEDLRVWKLEHDKRMELILKSKEAQILIVDHGAVDDSDDFSENDDNDDDSIEDDEREILDNMMKKYNYRSHYPMKRHFADCQPESTTAAGVAERNSNNTASGASISASSMEESPCFVGIAEAHFSELGRFDQSFDVDDDTSESRDLHSETSSSSPSSLSLHQPCKSPSGGFRDLATDKSRSVHSWTASRNQSDISLAPLKVTSQASAEAINRTQSRLTELSSPRQKKLRVGPTGLPLLSQTQQPVIRNNMAVLQSKSGIVQACRPAGASQKNIVLLPSQPRIQRHLPEPPALVSHPPSSS